MQTSGSSLCLLFTLYDAPQKQTRSLFARPGDNPKERMTQANHGRVKLAALSAWKLSCMSHEPGADADCLSAARHCLISASLER